MKIALSARSIASIYLCGLLVLSSACQRTVTETEARQLTASESYSLHQVVLPALGHLSSLDSGANMAGPNKPGPRHLLSNSTNAPDSARTSEPVVDQMAQTCEKELCQNTPSFDSVLALDGAIAENQSYIGKLKPLIQKSYKYESLFLAGSKQRLKKIFAEKTQISSDAQDLIYLFYCMSIINKVAAYIQFDLRSQNFFLDYTKYIAENPSGSIAVTQDVANSINLILATTTFKLMLNGDSFSELVTAIQQANPGAFTSKAAVTTMIAEATNETLREMFSVLRMKPLISTALNKALARQALTETDLKSLMKDSFLQDVALLALNGPLHGLAQKIHFFDSPPIMSLISIPSQRLDSYSRDFLAKKEEFCINNSVTSLYLAPTSKQLTKLKQTAELAKKLMITEVQSTLSPTISPDAAAEIKSQLEKTAFTFPDTKSTIAKALQDSLVEKNSAIAATTSDEAMWIQYIKLALNVALMPQNKPEDLTKKSIDQNIEQEASSECALFMQQPVSDKSNLALNTVSVSSTAAQENRIGFAILAHELGHIASKAIRGESSRVLRSEISSLSPTQASDFACILRRLNNSDADKTDKNGFGSQSEDKYLEESFADNFSVRLELRRSQATAAIPNIGCFLQKNFAEGPPSATNPDPDTVHPALLFRALTTHQDINGKLPVACSNYLEKQGYKQFGVCPARQNNL